eukprot:scaffold14356_cov194-Skeletonema_marinoi.AAC.10
MELFVDGDDWRTSHPIQSYAKLRKPSLSTIVRMDGEAAGGEVLIGVADRYYYFLSRSDVT